MGILSLIFKHRDPAAQAKVREERQKIRDRFDTLTQTLQLDRNDPAVAEAIRQAQEEEAR